MGNAIKDRYNYESLRKLALDIKSVYSDFQTDGFCRQQSMKRGRRGS